MSETTRDWSAWVAEERRKNGLGVCCSEAQGDGVPCRCVDGDCEQCRQAAGAFARTQPSPSPDPLLDPSYG
jgi:hypothetical protein